MEHLKDALPTIAQQAGVVLIVEQPLYRDPSVQEVDVTPWLVKKFESARKKGPQGSPPEQKRPSCYGGRFHKHFL
jgi:hypothetical protein